MNYDGIHYTCAIHQVIVNIKTKEQCKELDCACMNKDCCWLQDIFEEDEDFHGRSEILRQITKKEEDDEP